MITYFLFFLAYFVPIPTSVCGTQTEQFSLIYMNKNLVALTFLLRFTIGFCQAQPNFQVTGQLHFNKVGIPYGTIVFNNKENGLNTDEAGNFSFVWNGKPDTLLIECIGFKQEKIVLNQENTAAQLNVEMKPILSTFVMSKIVHLKAKSKGKSGTRNTVFRPINAKFDTTFQCGLKFDEAYLAARQIKKIQFFLLKNSNFDAPFRIRIYALKNGLPTNDLSDYQLIGHVKKSGWNEFDVSKYDFIIPKSGCFVAMEWLVNDRKYDRIDSKNSSNYGQTLGLSYNVENNKGLRKYNLNPWLTHKNSRKGSSDEDFYYASPMIKIDVE